MFKNMSQNEAKQQILDLVSDYYKEFHVKKEYSEGDRIPYAARVYNENEMVNLVDSALEFWLTAGRYSAEFEKKFAKFLGVKYSFLVNSAQAQTCLLL